MKEQEKVYKETINPITQTPETFKRKISDLNKKKAATSEKFRYSPNKNGDEDGKRKTFGVFPYKAKSKV